MGVYTGTRMQWRPWRTTHSYRGTSFPSVDMAFSRQSATMEEVSTHWATLLPWPCCPRTSLSRHLSGCSHHSSSWRASIWGPCCCEDTSTIVMTSVSLPTSYLIGEISIGWSWWISEWQAPWDSFPTWSPLGEGNSAHPTILHKKDPWVYLGDSVLLGSMTLATGQSWSFQSNVSQNMLFFLIICLIPASMCCRKLEGGRGEPWLIKVSKLKQSYLLTVCFEVSIKYVSITHKNCTLCIQINQHPMELALLRTLLNHRLKIRKGLWDEPEVEVDIVSPNEGFPRPKDLSVSK